MATNAVGASQYIERKNIRWFIPDEDTEERPSSLFRVSRLFPLGKQQVPSPEHKIERNNMKDPNEVDLSEEMDKQTMKAYERGLISWQEACRKEADRQIKLGNQELSKKFLEESKKPEPKADEDDIPPHELAEMLN